MHLENPKEYLSLVKGEDNFSEVYGFRYELCFVLSKNVLAISVIHE
jgi:hypothetical protein